MKIKNFSQDELKRFKNLLEYFKKFTSGGINSTEEIFLLEMLDYSIRFYFFIPYSGVFEKIQRITINKKIQGSNKRIKEISKLKYPPSSIVKHYGRCNLPRQSVFYGTFDPITAIDEMKPEYGDLITQTIWINREGKPIIYCPIFLNQPDENFINEETLEFSKYFYKKIEEMYPENIQKHIITLSRFISDCFAKRVDSNNDKNYLFSAYFSNQILHKLDGGRINAIYYPSVQKKLSFQNIAIKPTVLDETYKLSRVVEEIIVQVPNSRFRGYFMERISDCKSFDYTNNKIIWKDAKMNYEGEELEKLKKEFKLNLD